MPSLIVRDLTKKYNTRTVFSGLSLEHRNGVLGISGANGSGKSTLIKCLAFLLRPSSGFVQWKIGDNMLTADDFRNHIGIAAPYINLYDELSGQENLQFLQQLSGQDTDPDLTDELISLVGMQASKESPYRELSTGQQQRFRLAASLIDKPEILLLDEPGSNLDEDGRILVDTIIQQQIRSGGMVVLASNSPDELRLADKVVRISRSLSI